MTSHRSRDATSLKLWLADSLFRRIEFSAFSESPNAPEPEEFEAAIDRRKRDLASGRMAWSATSIPVDGRPTAFEVLRVSDAWIGVGTIEGVVITIHAERFGLDAVRLVRITTLDQYIGVF